MCLFGERLRLCEAFSVRMFKRERVSLKERGGGEREKSRQKVRASVRNITEYGFNAARWKSNYVIRSHKEETRVETFAKPPR